MIIKEHLGEKVERNFKYLNSNLSKHTKCQPFGIYFFSGLGF